MRVCVTGGAGYVGSRLVPHLLAEGHRVTVLDTFWLGNPHLPTDNDNLTIVKGDIRDKAVLRAGFHDCDAVIHLACISNDTACQLDEALSTSINYDAFDPLVIEAKKAGIKRFIYCSSSSVYGVSHAPDVTEDMPLIPLTLYNKYKGMCEPLLLQHQADDFVCTIIRPATVCGYAPRMRFDLTVNVMTMHAVLKRAITVFGGQQKRPNLHINDMCAVYKLLLTAPDDKIAGQIFNVGRENLKVIDIAALIRETVHDEMGYLPTVDVTASTDNRSYHVNSDKIARVLGFAAEHSVEQAIRDMCWRFKRGNWADALTSKKYTNIPVLLENRTR
jgi:nucleoside-diphosphate-sugar epimerase